MMTVSRRILIGASKMASWWPDFERNQHLIAENANGKSYMGRGSIRRGKALLPGLFRCARCGRRLRIQYTGKGGNTQR
jgi:hypothetical protein